MMTSSEGTLFNLTSGPPNPVHHWVECSVWELATFRSSQFWRCYYHFKPHYDRVLYRASMCGQPLRSDFRQRAVRKYRNSLSYQLSTLCPPTHLERRMGIVQRASTRRDLKAKHQMAILAQAGDWKQYAYKSVNCFEEAPPYSLGVVGIFSTKWGGSNTQSWAMG